MNHKFVVVDSDQWQGLYVDGVLVFQYHSVDLVSQLKKFGVDISSVWADSDPTLYDTGKFPARLEDVDQGPQGL